MIKVKINDGNVNTKTNSFPRLKRSAASSAVFFVTGRNHDDKFQGIILSGISRAGMLPKDGYRTFNGYSQLYDFDGELTISND